MTGDSRPTNGPEHRALGRLIIHEGQLIAGRYRVIRQLARGGQAAVFLARQEPLGRLVALKVLTPTDDSSSGSIRDFQERFLLEARALASLSHPNIVIVYDFGHTPENLYYIAMEYVDGPRFNDLLGKGSLKPQRAIRLIYQISQALGYAHRRNVVHRDIKHSNILVQIGERNQEHVKVVDFGIAKIMGSQSTITKKGDILGSPRFMAPEQAQGDGVDHRADIYALGVLLYRALTSKYPFDGPNLTATIMAHLTKEIPPFSTSAPDVVFPPGLEEVVRRCLSRKPEDRFASMERLQDALAEFFPDAPRRVLVADPEEEIEPTESLEVDVESTEGTLHTNNVSISTQTVRPTRRLTLLMGLGVLVLVCWAAWAMFLRPSVPEVVVEPEPEAPVVVEPAPAAVPLEEAQPSLTPPSPAPDQIPAPVAPRPAPVAAPAPIVAPVPVVAEPPPPEPQPASDPEDSIDSIIDSSDLRDPWAE